MSDIGVVIITYNSRSEVGACLDAVLRTGADVAVVDNGSQDGTIAEIAKRGVRLIANQVNRGFAAAANQGFRALDSAYILLLNPDAVVQTNLEPLREACALTGAAAAGGKLLDHSGKPQIGFMVRQFPTPAALILEALLLNRVWPGNPINRRYRALELNYETRLVVEQPAGAFLMVRRSVWEELGGFDEKFFPLWFEDVDFCRRAADLGYVLYYIPHAVAKHTGGHSIPQLTVEMRRYYWYCSLLRYSAKHFHPSAFRMVSLAVVTGSCLRMAAEVLSRRSLQPVKASGRVVRLASRCLLFGWEDGLVSSAPHC